MGRATLDFALNEALVTLQNRQGLDGIIGLWPGSASGDLFLQAYAADFLALAKAEGIDGAAALHELSSPGSPAGWSRPKTPISRLN